MSDCAIRVDNVSKKFRIYGGRKALLLEALTFGIKRYHHDFHALKNVSFEVMKGDTVGIVGQNGSGKSTLLQIIAGVMQPTEGSVTVNGRVASLLELGAGFNQEFSGRDNVMINGALLGFSEREMEERMPRIEEFADIGEFIDQPMKTYSSGMYVRLAFSAAINVDPEILIVDEALAVGDAAFQLKCMKKMDSFFDKGVTILFVSHSLESVRYLCKKSIWISRGMMIEYGPSMDVCNRYNSSLHVIEKPLAGDGGAKENKTSGVIIGDVTLVDEHDNPVAGYTTTSLIRVRIEIQSEHEIEDSVLGCALLTDANAYLCGLNTRLDKRKVVCRKGKNVYYCTLRDVQLLSGSYYITVALFEKNAFAPYDFKDRACGFSVTWPDVARGMIVIPHDWSIGDE